MLGLNLYDEHADELEELWREKRAAGIVPPPGVGECARLGRYVRPKVDPLAAEPSEVVLDAFLRRLLAVRPPGGQLGAAEAARLTRVPLRRAYDYASRLRLADRWPYAWPGATRAAAEAKALAFLAALKANGAPEPGSSLSHGEAARIAGVAQGAVKNRIAVLRSLGLWSYAPGVAFGVQGR